MLSIRKDANIFDSFRTRSFESVSTWFGANISIHDHFNFFSVILTPPHHLDEEARFARAPDSDRGRGSKEESRNEEITPFGERNNIR